MRLLLDTHLLLWAAARSERLTREARRLIEDPGNEIYWSVASLWEIAIKASLRRKDFRIDVKSFRPAFDVMGFRSLPIKADHAEELAQLPEIHRDPFDRMLVAQALTEPLILLSNDETLSNYGAIVRIV
ncbi:MAG: type II toxin-antitoxin system VapC family toxin [Vicinamibacteria bacterium]